MRLERDSYPQLAAMFLPSGGGGGSAVFGSKRSTPASSGQPQKFANTTTCPPGMVKTGGGQEHKPVAFIGDKPWKPYVMCAPAPAPARAPAPAPSQIRVEVSPTFQQQFTPSISPVFQQIEDSPGAAVGATTTQAGVGEQAAMRPAVEPGGGQLLTAEDIRRILGEQDDARRREESERRAREQAERDAAAGAARQREEEDERRRREEDERARAELEAKTRAELEQLQRDAAREPTVTIQPASPPQFFAPTPAPTPVDRRLEVIEGELVGEEPDGLPIGVLVLALAVAGGAVYYMQQRRKP